MPASCIQRLKKQQVQQVVLSKAALMPFILTIDKMDHLDHLDKLRQNTTISQVKVQKMFKFQVLTELLRYYTI